VTEGKNIVNILIIEDNLDDIEITKRALKEAKIINKLQIARDGQEALDFLKHRGQYQDKDSNPKPGLILLDINLPKVNGLEVLKKIRADVALKRIPVVVLTVSKRDEDIVRSYNNGCNSYIQKPIEFEEFVKVVTTLGLYWGLVNIPAPNNEEEIKKETE